MPNAEEVVDLSWRATFKAKRKADRGKPHRKKPDRDNIDKAILDVLFPEDKGGDQAIAKGTLEKVWGEQDGLEITLTIEGK